MDKRLASLQLLPSVQGEPAPTAGHEHYVQFYENDLFLVKSVTDFIVGGDCGIIIATRAHRDLLEQSLKTQGIDIIKAQVNGRLVFFDAEETLSSVMTDGMPDKAKFTEVVGSLIKHSSQKNLQIRTFGDMVAILWGQGHRSAAIELEHLWNELGRKHTFSLYCAYPLHRFDQESHSDAFGTIGLQHTHVIPAESFTKLIDQNDRLREIARLQQKAQSLEAEIEKRQRLEKQKDEFIGIASHELKTPVTSIKAYAQILQKRLEKHPDPATRALATKMDKHIDKLSRLINDLLDSTRIEAGKIRFDIEKFNMNSLIEEVAEASQLTTDKHKISMKLAPACNVSADRNRISQVLTNLLANAVKYSPDADEIVVKTVVKQNAVTVMVQDFGLGISPKDQNKIFERFYRATEKKAETYPGIGLGLYISSEIIRRHKGQIWVESKKGSGSTFFFSLPLI